MLDENWKLLDTQRSCHLVTFWVTLATCPCNVIEDRPFDICTGSRDRANSYWKAPFRRALRFVFSCQAQKQVKYMAACSACRKYYPAQTGWNVTRFCGPITIDHLLFVTSGHCITYDLTNEGMSWRGEVRTCDLPTDRLSFFGNTTYSDMLYLCGR